MKLCACIVGVQPTTRRRTITWDANMAQTCKVLHKQRHQHAASLQQRNCTSICMTCTRGEPNRITRSISRMQDPFAIEVLGGHDGNEQGNGSCCVKGQRLRMKQEFKANNVQASKAFVRRGIRSDTNALTHTVTYITIMIQWRRQKGRRRPKSHLLLRPSFRKSIDVQRCSTKLQD